MPSFEQQELGSSAMAVESPVPERVTLQENPRFISDKELDDARRERDMSAFTYQDLLDNLSITKKDLEFVTGKANRMELQNRKVALEAAIQEHPTSRVIRDETEKNYEDSMSFNELQRGFIKSFGKQSGYQISHDYAEYLAAKKTAEQYWDMKVSQYKTNRGVFLPNEFDDMTISEAFEKIFPQSTK